MIKKLLFSEIFFWDGFFMQEISDLLVQAGWIAFVLGFFSVVNFGIFLFVIVNIHRMSEVQTTMDPSLKSESYWEDATHSLAAGISWISSLAGLSTLIGLFGTVIGIQKSFKEMQITGDVGIQVFAGGVSFALSTTILGLGVAIFSYLLYQICRTKLATLEKNFFQSQSK